MNPGIKAEWVRRLRSEEYLQTQGRLREVGDHGQPDSYCCLGVLCEYAVDAGVIPPAVASPWLGGSMQYGDQSDTSTSDLPDTVKRWADLDNPEVSINYPGNDEADVADYYDLATVNDDLGYDFNKIADLIEAQL